MTACYLALQCTFKWLHLKNDLSLRRSAKYCVFLQDKNGSQFRWNRKVEVRKCLPVILVTCTHFRQNKLPPIPKTKTIAIIYKYLRLKA